MSIKLIIEEKQDMSIDRSLITKIIQQELAIDLGNEGDITSLAIIDPQQITAFIISNREDIILCGSDIIDIALPNAELSRNFSDGELVKAGSIIAKGVASAQMILSIERTMLNLLQHLCGIATNTRKFVDLIKDTKAIIRDTRKTLPYLRILQKYAVQTGGGENHRATLDEMILIKDNHIALCGGVEIAVAKAKVSYPNKIIEVECDTIEQVEQAMFTGCDLILLDNMSIADLTKAVNLVAGKIKLEASGGVNLQNVKAIAETGVDYIAIGSLTHSVKASDIGLDISAYPSNANPIFELR